MFTGLIRTMGTITRCEHRGDLVLEITADDAAFPLSLGASIACHGICLTVTHFADATFTVALSAETLACTNAAQWQLGTRINLEPSLSVGDALGGHFVSGHVDGLASITGREPSGDSTIWEFAAPPELMGFIARKGSVAINGTSLTVNSVANNRFTVNIIEHTAKHTTFGDAHVGDTVNLEVDLLARYAARLMETRA
ncbi:MAG: hypothetical protein B7X02_00760 [Rhodospirillales bacterium 12-54-5]|nr:MAG: hypothetical protein B7X02_00760 [Rhodospirillales bacterium 12-54-5]